MHVRRDNLQVNVKASCVGTVCGVRSTMSTFLWFSHIAIQIAPDAHSDWSKTHVLSEKMKKHSPAARVLYISLMFLNAGCVLSQCNTRLRLLCLFPAFDQFRVLSTPTLSRNYHQKQDRRIKIWRQFVNQIFFVFLAILELCSSTAVEQNM